MANEMTLQPVLEHGWRSGFVNLMRKESSLWWGTRKWWVQLIVWSLISNGIVAFILWVIPLIDRSAAASVSVNDIPELARVFVQLEAIFTSFGVMVLVQSLVVNEKKLGTAAWVLSNPVSRSSFIFAKLLSHGWAIFIILIVAQNLLFYLQIALRAGLLLDPMPLIAANAVLCLLLFFLLALGLLLGTLFDATGPVIGISIGLVIGMTILPQILGSHLQWLQRLLPTRLGDIAVLVAVRQALPADWTMPVISTACLGVLCIVLAIVRLSREEF